MREIFVDAYRIQENEKTQNVAPKYPQRPFNIETYGRGPMGRGGFG